MGYRNYRTQPRGSVRRSRRSFTRLKYTTIGKDFKGFLWQGLALAVQEFLVPGHLDGFELRFIGGRGIAGKAGEFGDPLVHVGEADGQRIGVRMFVDQSDGYIFKTIPAECWRHFRSRKGFNTEGAEIAKKGWRDKPAATTKLMIEFLGVIFVPIGNFHHDVGGAVGDGLAAEARLRGDAGGFVEFIELGVGGLVAGLEAFAHDDVARGAGANAAAGVVEASFESFGNVQDAAGQTVVTVGNFFRIDLDGLAAGKKGHFIFLRGGFVFDFFNVRIASAHDLSPKRWRRKAASTIRDDRLRRITIMFRNSRHRLKACATKTLRLRRACGLPRPSRPRSSSAIPRGARSRDSVHRCACG